MAKKPAANLLKKCENVSIRNFNEKYFILFFYNKTLG